MTKINWKYIRELFWPLLDPPGKETAKKADEIIVPEENVGDFYDLAVRLYEDENDRKASVEGKSTIFVSSIGFTTAILVSVTKDLVLNTSTDFPSVAVLYLFLLVVIVIYFARAVWFAVKALERRRYSDLGHSDIISLIASNDYKLNLAMKVIKYTIKNQKVVNDKVDCMVMAHEYFKRAIVAIVVYSFTLLVTSAITRYIKYVHDEDKLIKLLSSTSTGTWLLLACLLVFVIDFFYLYKSHQCIKDGTNG